MDFTIFTEPICPICLNHTQWFYKDFVLYFNTAGRRLRVQSKLTAFKVLHQENDEVVTEKVDIINK